MVPVAPSSRIVWTPRRVLRCTKKRKEEDSAGSDDTASMVKEGGYSAQISGAIAACALSTCWIGEVSTQL